MLLNDFIYTISKYVSTSVSQSKYKRILFNFIVPILQFSINLSILNQFSVEGYYKTFSLFKWVWSLMNFFKTILTFNKVKFLSDVIKLFDTIWLVNMILIIFTDPLTNTDDNPNLITFYEIYFNYLEFHILILAAVLIYNHKNIEDDSKNLSDSTRLYTTASLLGHQDSYRYCVILLFAHYYFVILNGISYSF